MGIIGMANPECRVPPSADLQQTEKIVLFRRASPVHNQDMKYGYARVSTDGQSLDAQVRQLTKAGCRRVFRETASGAKTDRDQLRRVIAMGAKQTRSPRKRCCCGQLGSPRKLDGAAA